MAVKSRQCDVATLVRPPLNRRVPENGSPAGHATRTPDTPDAPLPSAESLIAVLIVEALPLLRWGLAAALSEDPRIEIVGILEDPREAVEAAKTLRPRVVLMGSQSQQIDGIQSTQRIKDDLPDVDVIVIGASEEEPVIFSAIEAGAVGYVLQDITPEDLRQAIHSVCNGMAMVHPRVVRKMVDRLTLLSQKMGAAAGLTSRELDVLLSMAAGQTDKEIAREFSLTEATVKRHIRTVFLKTGAVNRVQAVALAMRAGLIR